MASSTVEVRLGLQHKFLGFFFFFFFFAVINNSLYIFMFAICK